MRFVLNVVVAILVFTILEFSTQGIQHLDIIALVGTMSGYWLWVVMYHTVTHRPLEPKEMLINMGILCAGYLVHAILGGKAEFASGFQVFWICQIIIFLLLYGESLHKRLLSVKA